jgi:Tic22-like family
MRRALSLTVALAFLALPSAAGAARGKDSYTFQSKGLGAQAAFSSVDASGCVESTFTQTATDEHGTLSGEGSRIHFTIAGGGSILNRCTGEETYLFCSTSTGTIIDIDPKLEDATISGTLQCENVYTGETCQVSKSETLQGVGEVRASRVHTQQTIGEVFINTVARAQGRSAVVTSATITGCGWAFTETDAVPNYAVLYSGFIVDTWIFPPWQTAERSYTARYWAGGLASPQAVLVYAVLSPESERAIELFVRREDAERFLDEVRGDEPELTDALRVEPVELDA